MEAKEEYIPGTCNIDRAGIQRRRRIGFATLSISVALTALLMQASVAREWRLLLFLPYSYAAICFLQARMKFCVKHGLKSEAAFGSQITTKPEHTAVDRVRSFTIILYAAVIGAAISLLLYFLG